METGRFARIWSTILEVNSGQQLDPNPALFRDRLRLLVWVTSSPILRFLMYAEMLPNARVYGTLVALHAGFRLPHSP